jgi:hypothetical protein
MNTGFDLEQYRVKPEVSPPPETAEQAPSIDLEQYRVHPEDTLKSGIRQTAQASLSLLENIIGAPASLNNLIMTGIEKVSEAVAGQELPAMRKFADKFRETGKTPEYFREKEKELTGGEFEPRNKREEAQREIAGDVGAFLNPLPGAKGTNVFKALGLALTGQGAKQGTKLLTKDEGTQDLVKNGAMFFTDLILRKVGKNSTNKFIDNLYKQEESLIPKGAKTSGSTLQTGIDDVLGDIQKSNVRTPSSSLVERTAEQMAKDVQNGEVGVEALIKQKRRLNEIRGDPTLHKNEKPALNKLSKAIDDQIEHYGNSLQADPAFLKAHKSANESYAALAQSRKLTNFIHKNIPKSASHFVLTLFGEAALGYGAAIPGTIAATAGLYGAAKTGEFIYRVMKSPTLRNHYLDVLKQAATANAGAVTKSIRNLDEAIKKEGVDQEE